MPLFLYTRCREVTELIDICLAFWQPTQSHVKPDAISLLTACWILKSVYSQWAVYIRSVWHIWTEKMNTLYSNH